MPRMKRAAAALLGIWLLMTSAGAGAVLTPPYPPEPTADVWRTYDPELHYFYQQLTDTEKKRFSARYDCIALGKQELWDYPCGQLTYQNLARINYVLLYDCPELMYLPDSYLEALGTDIALIQKPDEAVCARHPALMAERLSQCLEAVDRIRQEPEWGESDFEKEMAADRYLVRHCVYEAEAEQDGGRVLDDKLRTAYGGLSYGRAVCEGYAAAMTLAMRCFGIPCARTNGVYYEGQAGHAWNVVQIGGEWYHEDPTWNDADDEDFLEDYFPSMNLPSSDVYTLLRSDPTRIELGFKNPICSSDRDNYYVRKGKCVGKDWQMEAIPLVWEALKEGKRAVGFRFTDKDTFNKVQESLLSSGPSLLKLFLSGVNWNVMEDARVLYLSW